MRKYLSELHKKSDHHKRNFAIFTSGTVTLIIFSIWSMVNFSDKSELALKDQNNRITEEVGPLESMRMNVASSLEAIKGGFGGIKEGVEGINLELEYREMRDGALQSYE